MPRAALVMPKMSMTMQEGELATWHVAVGDEVVEGQVVCEVLTDKVDMEVEATASGTVVSLEAAEGDVVAVGAPLAWVEAAEEGLMAGLFGDDGPAAAPGPAPAPAPDAAGDAGAAPDPALAPAGAGPAGAGPGGPPSPGGGPEPWTPVRAMPGARRLAAERGLDLAALAGSGPGGAVMLGDVPEQRPAPVPEPTPVPGAARPAPPPPAAAAPAAAALPAPAPPPLLAADLHPRGPAAPVVVEREVVLGPAGGGSPLLAARAVAALAAALAEAGPEPVRDDPRVGLVVPSPAGPVVLTVAAAHALDAAALGGLLEAGAQGAREGRVDVRLLAPPDATVALVEGVNRAVVPARPGTLLSLAVAAPADRVVALAGGVAVRSATTVTASGGARTRSEHDLAGLVARVAARLAVPRAGA
ncbi:biotin/lipoyl-containing protein [Vallicoccus soli]|uniref:Dihydrolipoamide acetyltransferase component of pyruvate dehydrogenase complex n=1 Tax=Vallicoccus soli TaxID=2339232 RepID=A0A3A3Z457_9ACTN|nr:biotin/lipoyl-containing protein [Vallicoccus soli]RJK97743.1 hypothetical protein D5H78_01730 [Vallicoccus soli]